MRFPFRDDIALALLLGACLSGGAAAMPATANAQEARTPPAAAPRAATPKAAAPKAAAPKAAASKADDRQLRMLIARMIESNRLTRGGLLGFGAVKLADSKIAGPREYTTPRGKKLITYCVSTKVDTPIVGVIVRSAGATIERLQDGKARVEVNIGRGIGKECTGPDVGRFHELERLRDIRRRELGESK